jgi:uncharacterized protein
MSGSARLFIAGPAGNMQGLWRSGGHPRDFSRAAIICHPHPLYGGTMENKVVARCARYISEAGIEAVRFNFRGVQQSDGSFDEGRGERDDLIAVIDHVLGISPGAHLAIVGFSFGAWIGLTVGADHPAVRALVGIAPPVRMFDFKTFQSSSKPALIVYAGNDQYTNPASTKAWIDTATAPVESVLIPDVDHFFGVRVDDVGMKVAEFVARVL